MEARNFQILAHFNQFCGARSLSRTLYTKTTIHRQKEFPGGRVVYVARNGYNGGHQSRGFESRFIEVILKLDSSSLVGFDFCRQEITLEQTWGRVIPPREITHSLSFFLFFFLFKVLTDFVFPFFFYNTFTLIFCFCFCFVLFCSFFIGDSHLEISVLG